MSAAKEFVIGMVLGTLWIGVAVGLASTVVQLLG
jgi:hypothetical protein